MASGYVESILSGENRLSRRSVVTDPLWRAERLASIARLNRGARRLLAPYAGVTARTQSGRCRF
jgi:hypothetical protein